MIEVNNLYMGYKKSLYLLKDCVSKTFQVPIYKALYIHVLQNKHKNWANWNFVASSIYISPSDSKAKLKTEWRKLHTS